MQENSELTAIDLFSGAGGLTLGLKMAGFKVVAAIEVEPKIAKTYASNHPEAALLIEDIRKVTAKEIYKKTGVKSIDLIAGCPPCQGFSKLTEKYHRQDERNGLVMEMGRLIKEILPKAIMMENVPGLAKQDNPIFNEFLNLIQAIGYKVNYSVLQLADFGIPQSRRRLVLLAGRHFEIKLPKREYSQKGDKKKGLKPWLTLKDALSGFDSKDTRTFEETLPYGGPAKFDWKVVSNISKISRKRLATLKSGQTCRDLPLKLQLECQSQPNGFKNVYGKLSWNKTPPTITSGFKTPSMGRFGHPSKTRTISVREAALIQTFPKDYRFETTSIGTVAEMIGNALPPKFAKIVSKTCFEALLSKS